MDPDGAPGISESVVEGALMGWLAELGYETRVGGEIAPGMPAAERDGYREVILVRRLREAIDRLNPGVPAPAKEEALRKVLRAESPSLIVNNRNFHRVLVNPLEIEVAREGGGVRGVQVRLIDFDDPDSNDWLAVNQFTVHERSHRRVSGMQFSYGRASLSGTTSKGSVTASAATTSGAASSANSNPSCTACSRTVWVACSDLSGG